MRLMSHLSHDPNLQSQLHAGGDLFKAIASSWHRKPAEAVSAIEREQTKQLCYGLCYGMGESRVAQGLSLDSSAARALKQGFLNAFPRLANLMDRLKAGARRQGFVRGAIAPPR